MKNVEKKPTWKERKALEETKAKEWAAKNAEYKEKIKNPPQEFMK